jgi:hypothetical protein
MLTTLMLSARRNAVVGSRSRAALTSSPTNLALRQDSIMNGPKRERWTEAEVAALPSGEHDYFDRKSGALLTSGDFRKDLAKAISAFANSGGGHLVIGVEDDGTFSGVVALRGRTATREWLEQVIPTLVSFPLEDFRVHEVEPAPQSNIPAGKVILVVDVGDSVLAPHQSESARVYYYREGGHSKPAPHFYLETLRNRLTRPMLTATLVGVHKSAVFACEGGVFVETRLEFLIKNTGRVAAYKWALIVEGTRGDAPGRESDYKFSVQTFPKRKRDGRGGIRLDDTILPSLAMMEERDFGFLLRAPADDREALLRELRLVVSSSLTLRYRVVTETSPGESATTTLVSFIDHDEILGSVLPLESS